MSASTVSITANPAARRRPLLAAEKKSAGGIEFLPREPQVNGGDDNARDLSHHSIRGEAVLERTTTTTANVKDQIQARRTVSPRRSRKAAVVKAEKPMWLTMVSIFTKNLLLLIVLIGLVHMVRRLALTSGDYDGPAGTQMGLTELEGRIGEYDSSLKTTARMIQLQLEVINKKIENEVGGLRTEMSEKIDKTGALLETQLKKLEIRAEELEYSVGELKAEDWLSKEEFEELRKGRVGEFGGNDLSLDEIRVYARELVKKEIEKHAADGLGRADYAVASAGAMVVKHSEAYSGRKLSGWFFKWPVVRPAIYPGVHPEANRMLKPSFGEPGQCFPLKGSNGFVQIRLRTTIIPEAITLEHVAKSVSYDRSTAPKDCRVSGWLQGRDLNSAVDPEKMFLLTEFTYDLEKSNAQTFNVLESAASHLINTVRLDFTSNHGSPLLTCLYRLRVHGSEPDDVAMMAMQEP